MRTPHWTYPEYHTSGDNLEFVRPERLAESLRAALAIVDALEANRIVVSLNPKCEPQLGRRGLYTSLGGLDRREAEMAVLWTLNLADGAHTALDIAERSGMPFQAIACAVRALAEHGLLKEHP
jgi:aminopeptidase-like protein